VLKAHLDNVLNRVVTQSDSAWLPLAMELVADLPLSQSPSVRRAPLSIWIPVDGPKDITDFIEDWLKEEGRVDWSGLFEINSKRPYAIFAITSTLALFFQDWSNANRFAEVALRAYQSRTSEDTDRDWSGRWEAELNFLVALTQRFCLGDIEPFEEVDRKNRSVDTWTGALDDTFKTARVRLDRSLLVDDTVDTDERRTQQLVYELRAHSERGALHLFYAASFISEGRIRTPTRLRRQGIDLVSRAMNELDRCLVLEKQLDTSSYKRFVQRLQFQYVPIIAATEVVRYLLMEQRRYKFDIRLREHVDRVQEYLAKNRARKFKLVHAEMLAFFILAGVADDNTISDLADVIARGPEPPLVHDRRLLSAIRSRFLRKH
jgi:hypothetical protein